MMPQQSTHIISQISHEFATQSTILGINLDGVGAIYNYDHQRLACLQQGQYNPASGMLSN
jgi:hypothetical protein